MGEKKISDLITENTVINTKGEVTGTLKYVKNWTDFSNIQEEQSGHFFPVTLGEKYRGKTIKVVGEKEKTAQDTEWVLRVEDNDSTFRFSVDGENDGNPFLTLSFKNAELSPAPAAISSEMTKAELVAYAREHSIPEVDSSMKKAEILDKIKNSD